MKYYFASVCVFLSTAIYSQSAIKGKSVYKHLQFLSSDELKGRWPGTREDSITGEYIMTAFSKSGIKPLFQHYTQPFEVTVKLEAPADSNFIYANSKKLVLNKHYSIFPFSGAEVVSAPILFTDNNETSFEAQQYIKSPYWMVLWRYKTFAPATDTLSDYAISVRAMRQGASGVILISPDSVDSKDILVRLRPRNDQALSIPVLHFSRSAWWEMKEYLFQEKQADNVSKLVLSGSVKIHPEKIIARNLAGVIEGNDPQLKNEYIILGAHYDHLGFGGFGTGSLKPDTIAIHNGADDNASGTAVLIEIAKVLQRNRKQLKRSIIVIAFAAEEEGLLGSQYFVNHLPVQGSSIKVMLNMDMVGRLNNDNQLYMGGAGTFPGGVDFMKSQGKGDKLNLVIHAGGVGGSDHVSFYRKGIPAIGMHTGGHPQYHTPEDDSSLINVPGVEQVARYIYRTVKALSNREGEWDFIRQE